MNLVEECLELLNRQKATRQQTISPELILNIVQQWIATDQRLTQRLIQETEWPAATIIECLELINESLRVSWSKVRHLHALFNDPSWKEPYEQALVQLEQTHALKMQNHALYARIQDLHIPNDHPQKALYERRVARWCRDFERGGIHLETTAQKEFQTLSEKQVALENQFEEQITASRDSWLFWTHDVTDLTGLPEHLVEAAQREAKKRGEKDAYCFLLTQPTYQAIMRHAEKTKIRETFYRAYQTIASAHFPGPVQADNTLLAFEILSGRDRLAHLIGFQNIPEYLLEYRMLKDPQSVITFLKDFKQKVTPQAQKELNELRVFFKTTYQQELHAWDLAFAQEQMKKKQSGVDSELIRSYFPFAKVQAGLNNKLTELFGIECVLSQNPPFPLWDPAVKCYDIYDKNQGTLIGSLIMDLFARPGKRQGAWMDECQSHFAFQSTSQKPIAFLTCNFSAPPAGQDAYLTHEEILTLFHEMGHCLHHLLTQVPIPSLGGIFGVEWDAVELPSQFLECFAWEGPLLKQMSEHRETKAALPDDLLEKLIADRNFQNALYFLRQIEMSLFDMTLHLEFNAQGSPDQIHACIEKVRQETGGLPVPEYVRFENQFAHIFSGGYAAGYYSYLWAEIMAIDAYYAFLENPDAVRQTGEAFKKAILERGASENAEMLFQRFRGRSPKTGSFFHYYALAS